jgi:nitrogen fixation NifU-like protein
MSMELYQEVLLQHSRRPRNYGPLPAATHRAEGLNPLCGDEITVELALEEGVVREAKFTGSACAICTASASILTLEVAGQPVDQAKELASAFRKFTISGEPTPVIAQRPRLEVMGSVHKFPQRVKCATLPWETLVAATEHPIGGDRPS